MLRFNSDGDFNLPVGNVDFNKNVYKALCDYFDFTQKRNISFYNSDYKVFMRDMEERLHSLNKDTSEVFFYFDPPYLINGSEYNKLWNENREKELYEILKRLDSLGLQWGLSNLLKHKGEENTMLQDFMQNYQVYDIQSNYISFNDNSIKKDSQEVYVTNIKL